MPYKIVLLIVSYAFVTNAYFNETTILNKYCSSSSSSFGNDQLSARVQIEKCLSSSNNNNAKILQTFDKILNKDSFNKYEQKYLLLDIIYMINLINEYESIKFCLNDVICGLLQTCEFKLKIEYPIWEQDVFITSRLSSFLSRLNLKPSLDYNDNNDLMQSLLETTLYDNENIYNIKINLMNRTYESTKYASNESINFTISLNTQQEWMNFGKVTSDEARQTLTANILNKKYRHVSGIKYDCTNSIWIRVISVPIFDSKQSSIQGTSVVSIKLNNFDLKQCNDNELDDNIPSMNPFYGTSKCDPLSTQCSHIHGKGFTRGSYMCKCKQGFYHPQYHNFSGFSGTLLEDFYSNRTFHNVDDLNYYDDRFKCKPCPKGCAQCVDDRPCEIEIKSSVKLIAISVNILCILLCLILMFYTWYHMKLKVLKSSSPKMLFMILIGAIISYSEIVPAYFEPSNATCLLTQVLQLEGFLMAYGALVLKTWRECKLFYVKSIKVIRITDKSLFKRLLIIILAGATYLGIWSGVFNETSEFFKVNPNGIKYKVCSITKWNYVSMSLQLLLLVWGTVLSVQVRKAAISFKETKLITWAILNEFIVCLFVICIHVILEFTFVSPYVYFIFNFLRIHLTITVMLLLLFTYKINSIIKLKNKQFTTTSQLQGFLTHSAISDTNKDSNNNNNNDMNLDLEIETEKERELKCEIKKLYRQIEEMRSLSMRIANPHLLTKKSNLFSVNAAKKLKFKSKLANEASIILNKDDTNDLSNNNINE